MKEDYKLKDIVFKLVGNIEPVGDSNTDETRFENLKQLTGLIDDLIDEVEFVARSKISHEHSVKRAGNHAHVWLEENKQRV